MSGARDLQLTPAQRRLKRATKQLVKAVGGGDEAAEIAHSRQQRMSDCGLPNTPDFLRVDEVLLLEDEAVGCEGWPPVTRAMARHHGCILVRVPQRPASADWHREIGQLSKETGEVVQSLCKALTNGADVTAAALQANRVRAEIAEAQEALAALDALCARLEDEGPPGGPAPPDTGRH